MKTQMRRTSMAEFSPGRLLLASLLFIIICGTGLLCLPVAQRQPVTFLDALFTTVSTVCVTGLETVPINAYSPWGHGVILILMQIGGLGLMTLSFFIISLFLNLGMTSKMMAGQLFEFESWAKVKTFLFLIITLTFVIELIGTGALYYTFREFFPHERALFYAAFHAVSAFCNAGISPFENNLEQYISTPGILLPISFLVFAGGIGFIVWYECAQMIKHFIKSFRNEACPLFSLSLHSKLALVSSFLLILFGTLTIWGIEAQHGVLHAFFTSISMRSAGFTAVKFATFSSATMMVLLVLMFIGASPGSTGSGIKTTTFVLYCATIWSIVHERQDVEINGRSIPTDQIHKAIAIITVSLAWIVLGTFCLLMLHPDEPFMNVLIEMVSAFSTAGVSLGLTKKVTLLGKILLMLSMMIGRIGPLTLVLALRRGKKRHLYQYPEERILIG